MTASELPERLAGFSSPAFLVVCAHAGSGDLQVFDFPIAVGFDIGLVVAGGLPACLVVFTEGKWPEEVPRGMGRVAVDAYAWVHGHVL